MTAAATDKFQYVGNPGTATTLAAPGYTQGNANINVVSTTNFPTATGVIFAVDKYTIVAGQQVQVPGSYCVFQGVVTSATQISSLGLLIGTPQDYPAGSTTRVYITVSSQWFKRLVDGLAVSLNQDGSLIPAAVRTALGIGSSSGAGWDILNAGVAPTLASGANKGNKEFDLTFTGVDLSGVLSAGMRIRLQRNTVPPTQCMAFVAASSQYGTKASPTGITFTGAFTTEAEIYLNSYNGLTNSIISRWSSGAVSGWAFQVDTSGRLTAYYNNASGTTQYTTIQSIPLKRWMHVAAVCSGTTITLYINGIAVPTTANTTAANTVVQAAVNLVVGASATPGSYFDGFISEARLWSTAQTQTQIRDNMAINLVGNETGLIGLWKGNGNFNDATSNANNLTATGGAIATQAANPFNPIEYAIVTKVAYGGANTIVTVFTGIDYTIPNATLSNPFSSYEATPFGWPADRTRWRVSSKYRINRTAAYSGANIWTDTLAQLMVPTGAFRAGVKGTLGISGTSGGTQSGFFALSDSTPTNAVYSYPILTRHYREGSITVLDETNNFDGVSFTTQTLMKLWAAYDAGVGSVTYQIRGDQGEVDIYAECAYA